MKRSLPASVIVFLLSVCAYGQSDIRAVDFKNFTYLVNCIAETPENVTVKNGEFSMEKQEEGYVDRFFFKVFEVAYGDLNGDRRDEAIVLTVCNTGGTGYFSEGFIFSMKAGKPVLVARIPGGDRADGGLRTTRVERGLLVVESNDPGEGGGACCPQVIVTTRYRLARDRITQVGEQTRRDVYPSERLTFVRGTSGKTFTTAIAADQGKRFIVGARTGQTLTVSIDSDKASLRFLQEADVKFGVNNFLVRLPKSGDYTIEIQNNSDAALTLTVTVRIQ